MRKLLYFSLGKRRMYAVIGSKGSKRRCANFAIYSRTIVSSKGFILRGLQRSKGILYCTIIFKINLLIVVLLRILIYCTTM